MPHYVNEWNSTISRGQVLVVVGPKCPYCKVVENAINLLLPVFPKKDVFFAPGREDIISRYNVRTFPTIIYRNGGKIEKEEGKTTLEKIREILSL